jgi:hypothetical protein
LENETFENFSLSLLGLCWKDKIAKW